MTNITLTDYFYDLTVGPSNVWLSPMFISKHANAWDAKQMFADYMFFNNPNYKFFCDS